MNRVLGLTLLMALWLPLAALADSPVEHGIALFREGHLDEAAHVLEAAVKTEHGEPLGLAHKFLGNIQMVRGDLDGAATHYDAALAIFRQSGNSVEATNTLSNQAVLADRRHQYTAALQLYQAVLAADVARNDAFAQGLTHMSMGEVLRKLARFDEALQQFRQASTLFASANKPEHVGFSTLAMAKALYDQSRLDEAEKACQQALGLFEQAASASGRCQVLYHLARLHWRRGHFGEARLQALSALQAATESKVPVPRGEVLNLLGLISEDLGQLPAAMDYYQKAVHEFGRDQQGLASTLQNIGNLHLRLGAADEAADAFGQALLLFEALHDQSGVGSACNSLGLVARRQQKYDKAADYFARALQDAKSMQDVAAQILALNNLAHVRFLAGQTAEALQVSDQASALCATAAPDAAAQLGVLALRGSILARLGQKELALAAYAQAIGQVEQMRGHLQQQKLKATFLEDKGQLYEMTIALLADMGKDAEVFEYLERARSRAFLDMMGNQKLRTQAGSHVQELADEELATEEGIRVASNDQAMRKAVAAHEKVLAELRQSDPEYASQRGVDPVSVKTVQQALDSKTALVEYFLGRDLALACVVTADRVQMVRLPVPPSQIVDNVLQARKLINPAEKGDKTNPQWQNLLADLYQQLWAPVEPLLGGRKRVCVAPHGVLHYLPLEALVSQKDKDKDRIVPSPRFLVDDYTLFYCPSASVYRFARDKNPGKYRNALILGNAITPLPPLESAEAEALAIAKILPQPTVYLKEKATEAVVKQSGAQFDVIHLATHGELMPDKPMDSRILLSSGAGEDGFLTVREIFQMRLKAYLVVLSACESGEVASLSSLEYPPGDDLVGLTRSFLYAGTPSVIASLWPVDDRATSILMTGFYQQLKKMDKASALRQGQLAILQMGRKGEQILYTHPTLWAPFIVVGDYR